MIRQESRFETSATSSAGAQGLMQVMPATAQGIADRLGWSDFEPQQAYWPYVNVALGANYIGTWLAHFDGSLAAALAAYNGGPGNAATWRKWAPEDDDLMVALIDFNETRVYAQTVYAQYDTYQRLYPERP
jgi:soluble lytic murein transglycosylase